MYLTSFPNFIFSHFLLNLDYMAIGKKIDPSNERNSRYGFENKCQDITRDYRKERLYSETNGNMEDNKFTTDDSNETYVIPNDNNEIYVIPNDTNLDPKYITMEYCKGILLIQCMLFIKWFGWSIGNL